MTTDIFTIIDENTLLERAIEFVQAGGQLSAASFQREFKVGFTKAKRLVRECRIALKVSEA